MTLWESSLTSIFISLLYVFLFEMIFLIIEIFLVFFFFNHSSIYYLINVYSDLSQSALKYLKDTEVNLNNVLIMTGDFNIRDNFWDPNFPYHSSHRDTLFNIADSFWLELSKPTEFFPTKYPDNVQDSNLVLDLVFLHSNSSEHKNHHIHPD